MALHQYNEVVTLNPLPLDSADVIELLSAEAAPIPVWLDAAKAFMAQHNVSVGVCGCVLMHIVLRCGVAGWGCVGLGSACIWGRGRGFHSKKRGNVREGSGRGACGVHNVCVVCGECVVAGCIWKP